MDEQAKDNYYQPLWLLAGLYISTVGIYGVIWFYRNWKCLKYLWKQDISPLVATLCLLIPALNFLMAFKLFKIIRNCLDLDGTPGLFPIQFTFTLWVISFIGSLSPTPFWILSAWLGPIPLILVQRCLNKHYIDHHPGIIPTHHPSIPQYIILLTGVLVWLCVGLKTVQECSSF